MFIIDQSRNTLQLIVLSFHPPFEPITVLFTFTGLRPYSTGILDVRYTYTHQTCDVGVMTVNNHTRAHTHKIHAYSPLLTVFILDTDTQIIFANIEDTNVMPHKAAFKQELHQGAKFVGVYRQNVKKKNSETTRP